MLLSLCWMCCCCIDIQTLLPPVLYRGSILGHNWDTKVLRVVCLAIYITSTNGFPPSPSLSKSGLKLVCNVNIVYGNLKSENYQDMPRNLNEIVRS